MGVRIPPSGPFIGGILMIKICKHCNVGFDISNKPKGWMANHSRWCEQNPKISEYKNGNKQAILAMNDKRKETGITNQYTKAKIEGSKVPESKLKGLPGFFLGKTHSEETKLKQKNKALASPHRRLRRKMIEYNGVMLDSTWELELAKRLDALGIEWIRPDPIRWTDGENIEHNYFADFYLEDYDVYLDPKNPFAIKAQKQKLKYLLTQHKNVVIIKTLEECKNFSI